MRKNKLQATTINIQSIASSEVMMRMETATMLELFNKRCLPGFLNNCESWNLKKEDQEGLHPSHRCVGEAAGVPLQS